MKSMALSFAMIFLLIAVSVSADTYQIPFYTMDDSFPSTLEAVSTKTTVPVDCTVEFVDRASLLGSNFEFAISLESPSETEILTGSDSGLDSFINREILRFTNPDAFEPTNETHEGKTNLLTTAASGNHTLTADYVCELGAGITFNYDTLASEEDSYNNIPNRLLSIQQTVPAIANTSMISRGNLANYNQNGVVWLETAPKMTSTQSDTTDHTAALYYYFNSTNGFVNYTFVMGGAGQNPQIACATTFTTGNARLEFWLVNYETGSSVMLDDTAEVSCNPSGSIINTNFLGQLSGLQRDTIYYFMIYYVADFGATVLGSSTFKEPGQVVYTISAADTNISCGAWSECIEATQSRNCEDTNGIIVPFIEYRTCALGIIENATLGFEEFTSTGDILKCVPTWDALNQDPNSQCLYNIANATLDRPTGWTINDPAYGDANFLQMTQEFATQGTRGIKMWQIPPKLGEVVSPTECGNTTSSIIPSMFQGMSNDTFTVVHNVTFPATNMIISFDVKKCASQVVQHTALEDLNPFSNDTFCPEMCYANDCDTVPNGKYAFNIIDTNTSESIFGVPQFADAQLNTLTPTYDISNLGIIPGRTYNILFAISNENQEDATGNCIYLDNVQYQVTETDLLSLVPGCISRCVGSTRYEASTTLEGSCFVVTQDFSPLCTDSTTAEFIENQEDFCDENGLLQSFNEKTGKYESISCIETDRICSEGRCQTEEEAAIDDSTVPAEDTEAFLGWFNFLFSPLFIYLIIVFILAGVIAAAVGEGLATFHIFGSVVIIMMIVGTLPGIGIIPAWISIAIIVIVALMIARTLGAFAGNNG